MFAERAHQANTCQSVDEASMTAKARPVTCNLIPRMRTASGCPRIRQPRVASAVRENIRLRFAGPIVGEFTPKVFGEGQKRPRYNPTIVEAGTKRWADIDRFGADFAVKERSPNNFISSAKMHIE